MTSEAEQHARTGEPISEPPAPVVPRILVFYDYTCPFCFVEQFRFDQLRSAFEVDMIHVPFELRPEAPVEGFSASEQGLGHSEHIEQRLLEISKGLGHPMTLPDLVPNTHAAMAMAECARDVSEELFERVHRAIFSAYYEAGRDIGRPEVLLEIARAEGLDEAEVKRAWDERIYDDRLHEYYHLARQLGVSSTPAALICNRLLIGTRPYGILQGELERCMITPESLAGDEGESTAKDA